MLKTRFEKYLDPHCWYWCCRACCPFFDAISLDTLWIRFGVGNKVKFIACHEIANTLTPEFSKGLIFFHAWTGVDTVSSFESHGKKKQRGVPGCPCLKLVPYSPNSQNQAKAFLLKTWEFWKLLLSNGTQNKLKHPHLTMQEKPWCLKEVFNPISSLQRLLLSSFTHFVVTISWPRFEVWGRSLQRMQTLPGPCNFAWKQHGDGSYTPVWTNLQPASKNKINKICGCKTVKCARNCGCKTQSMCCTSLCLCRAQCDNKSMQKFLFCFLLSCFSHFTYFHLHGNCAVAIF